MNKQNNLKKLFKLKYDNHYFKSFSTILANFNSITVKIDRLNNNYFKNCFISKKCNIVNSHLENCIIFENAHIENCNLKDCVVFSNASIFDSRIFDNVKIDKFTKVRQSYIYENVVLGKNCTIGPFSHIHNDCLISNFCRIGNFVEIKKSTIGSQTKITHLSYVGDAELGNSINVGAGTIFCNYNGKEKNKTTIGSHTFIGSNSVLIAPLTVGDRCKIGAGSCVDKNLDDNTFYLSRTKNIKTCKNKF